MSSSNDPRVWDSFLWGLLSAVSLNIGSVVGVTCLPRKKVRAMLMSFGGGSLLFALSIELFGHVLLRSETEDDTGPVWIMEGSAILGGVLFAFLNRALNAYGADVRKPSTTKGRFRRLRGILMRRLALRLWKLPFFSELTLSELKELMQSAMNKERYRKGDIIVSHEMGDSGIFFIVSGMVRLTVSELDQNTCDGGNLNSTAEVRSGVAVHLDIPRPAPEPVKATDSVGEVLSWDLGPDQVFGDMAVLAGAGVRMTAMALESTKVLVLPGNEVMHLIETNPRVQNHVSLRALENLRQLEPLQLVPDSIVQSLLKACRLQTFRPGGVVFEGTVSESTDIMLVVFGEVEVVLQDRTKTTVHGTGLLCTEHLRGLKCQAYTAIAMEATSVLIVERKELDHVVLIGQRLLDSSENMSESTSSGSAPNWRRPTIVSVPSSEPAKDKPSQHSEFDQGPAWPTTKALAKVPAGSPRVLDKGLNRSWNSGAVMAEPPLLPGQASTTEKASVTSFTQPTPTHAWGTPTPTSATHSVSGLAHLGRDLGWDPEEDHDNEFQDRRQLLNRKATTMEDIVGLVTDQDLQEREQDMADMVQQRVGSKNSIRLSGGKEHTTEQTDVQLATVDVETGEANQQHPTSGGSAHGAIMVWLGILIDAIPESLVIGIIINKATSTGSTTQAALPFVIGVFLSNLPESMSSSGSMKAHGIRVRNILLMWWTITLLTAVGATTGAVLFPPGSSDDPTTKLVVSGVEGLAAGAMLTMIAQTMLPEAFEQGGDIVGLSCLAGFLCALSVKLIPFSHEAGGH